MRRSTRLLVNSLATVSRLLLAFALGLVTTRLLLGALGFVDFGLLSTLGASGVLLMLLSQAMAGSAQRHLAVEIGRGDDVELRRVFNSSFLLFLAVATAIAALGAALAPLLMEVLTIPEGREGAAWWTFHLVLATLVTTVLGTPFKGLLVARQSLVVVSAYEVLESVLRLLGAVFLLRLSGDRLIVWGCVMVGVRLVATALPVATCLARHAESRPRPWLAAWATAREVAVYAGWATLGSIAMRLRSQGGMLLLNVGFDPVVTGAYAIANRLSTQQTGFALAFQRAVQPAIVAGHARGERDRIHTLGRVADKYLLLFLAFALVPLGLETGEVLRLWLGDYPPHTVELVRLVLLWTTLPLLTRSYLMALRAEGDIGYYTRIQLALSVAALTVAGTGFAMAGLGPWALPAASLVAESVLTVYNLAAVGPKVGMRLADWLRDTVRPLALGVGPAAAAAVLAGRAVDPGLGRLAATCTAYAAVAAPLGWWAGLAAWERRLLAAAMRRAVAGGRLAVGDPGEAEPEDDPTG